jgi:MoxR-like ATPase
MPSDLTGTEVLQEDRDSGRRVFRFVKGPVFTNLLLADEINRAPAKTQSALFEVMEERQVTVDGVTRPVAAPFFVVATQNPVEQEGTYKLPEAQLDRFLFRVILSYPGLVEEEQILRRFRDDFHGTIRESVNAVLTPADIAESRRIIEQVYIREELLTYIATIVHNTRNNPDIFLGASPRASLSLLKSAKAVAAMSGRNFVTPDDIRYVSYPVLNHRIILTPEREMEGYSTREILEDIIRNVEVPR